MIRKINIFLGVVTLSLVLALGIMIARTDQPVVQDDVSSQEQQDDLGSIFRPSGIDISIRQDLAAGASRTGNTLVVDPIITKSGYRMTMADIGDIAFAKLDPNLANEEIISWTGMTDNTTTYTLTGVEWGYNFHNLATSTDNYKKHFSGARFIITNDDHWLKTQFAALELNNIFNQVQTFNYYPEVASNQGDATTTRQVVTFGQLANSLAQGSVTSTEAFGGILRIGTLSEIASSYYSVSDPTAVTTRYTTSTPSANIAEGFVPAVGSSGKLHQTFFDLTESWNFTSLLATSATTTRLVVGSSQPTTNAALWVGGNSYFNGNATSTGSVSATDFCLGTNCKNSLSEATVATSTIQRTALTNELDIVSFQIPANKLRSSNGIKIKATLQYTYPNDTSNITLGNIIKFGGSTVATCTYAAASQNNAVITIDCEATIINKTTGTQRYFGRKRAIIATSPFHQTASTEGELSVDTTSAVTVEVEQSYSTSANPPTININNVVVEYIWAN